MATLAPTPTQVWLTQRVTEWVCSTTYQPSASGVFCAVPPTVSTLDLYYDRRLLPRNSASQHDTALTTTQP